MVFAFFNLGFGEMFAIFVVVLLLFGADKIPEFARTLGKGIRYVKDATDGVKRDIQASVDDVKSDIDKNVGQTRESFQSVQTIKRTVQKDVEDSFASVKKDIDKAQEKFKKPSSE